MLRLFSRKPKPLGQRGEDAAAALLKQTGYRVLTRNLRNRFGEIDLVAEAPDGKTLVIVEVKSGSSDRIPPEVHVNRAKQKKLAALAAQLVRRYKQFRGRPIRFDVVAVVFHDDEPPTLRHHRGAFESPW